MKNLSETNIASNPQIGTYPEVELFRPYDAAPAASVTNTTMIRAQARKEQIMSTSRETSPAHSLNAVSSATRATRATRRYPAWRWVAIPAAAAAVFAAQTLAPDSASIAVQPAFASWTPTPQPVDDARSQAIANLCWTQIESRHATALATASAEKENQAWSEGWSNLPENFLASFSMLGAEARGDWTAVFWADSAENFVQCLVYTDPASGEQATIWELGWDFPGVSTGGINGGDLLAQIQPDSRNFGWSAAILTADDAMLQNENAMELGGEGFFNTAVGIVGPDVQSLVLKTVDGQSVTASIKDGMFYAWWPGQPMPQPANLGCPEMWYDQSGVPAYAAAADEGTLTELLAAAPQWQQLSTGNWVCVSQHTPAEMAQSDQARTAVEQLVVTTTEGTTQVWGVVNDPFHRLGAVPWEPRETPTGDPVDILSVIAWDGPPVSHPSSCLINVSAYADFMASSSYVPGDPNYCLTYSELEEAVSLFN